MDGINSKEFRELKSPGYNLYIDSGDSNSVLALQKQLNKWGYTDGYGRPLAEDGIYGKNTYNAVIKYQRDNGLTEDGIVGDKTWGSMSDRMQKEETKPTYSGTGGTINGYIPLGGYKEKDTSSVKTTTEKSEKPTGGVKFPLIPAIVECLSITDNLNGKVESDGEVYNAQKRIEQMDQNYFLLDPAVEMHTEDEVEDYIEQNKGFYGVMTGR